VPGLVADLTRGPPLMPVERAGVWQRTARAARSMASNRATTVQQGARFDQRRLISDVACIRTSLSCAGRKNMAPFRGSCVTAAASGPGCSDQVVYPLNFLQRSRRAGGRHQVIINTLASLPSRKPIAPCAPGRRCTGAVGAEKHPSVPLGAHPRIALSERPTLIRSFLADGTGRLLPRCSSRRHRCHHRGQSDIYRHMFPEPHHPPARVS
jgi:hypothetical protein